MGDVARSLVDIAILIFVLLPLTLAVGSALFLPWRSAAMRLGPLRDRLQRHGWILAGLALLLVPEALESWLDPYVTASLPAWWQAAPTNVLAAMDGDLHQRLQAAVPGGFVTTTLAAVYFLGFPLLIVSGVWVPVCLGRGAAARRALAAYVLCFAMALPFYLLFPVDEVWHHNPAVRNLLLDHPFVRDHLYAFNELNNSFPSLHTAASVAVAAVVWRSDGMPRRFRAAMLALATAIVFSTLDLGIHWSADVAAGLAVAAVAAHVAERWWPEGLARSGAHDVENAVAEQPLHEA